MHWGRTLIWCRRLRGRNVQGAVPLGLKKSTCEVGQMSLSCTQKTFSFHQYYIYCHRSPTRVFCLHHKPNASRVSAPEHHFQQYPFYTSFIFELTYAVSNLTQLKNVNTRISQRSQKKNSHNLSEFKLIWWCFVNWKQGCGLCANISSIDGIRQVFHLLW